MRTNSIFRGAATALITPMTETGVDYPALEKLINWQIDEGIDALVICGTTGESSTLTDAEHREVMRYSIERVAGRVPVICGTGSNETDYAVELTKAACEYGADAVKVLCSAKDFDKVVAHCPVPVVMAGGPKSANLEDVVKYSIDCGAKGCAIGRNVYGSDDPAGRIKALRKIVHGE